MYKRPYETPAFAIQYYVMTDTDLAANTPTAGDDPADMQCAPEDSADAEVSLEAIVDRPDWVRDVVTYRAWKQSLANPGVFIELPSKFRCRECGCAESRAFCGMEECTWCKGYGRRVGRV